MNTQVIEVNDEGTLRVEVVHIEDVPRTRESLASAMEQAVARLAPKHTGPCVKCQCDATWKTDIGLLCTTHMWNNYDWHTAVNGA